MKFSKSYKYIIAIYLSFFLSGCEFFDEMFEFESQKKKHNSVINRIEFETNERAKKLLITSSCKYNDVSYIYYKTMEDAHKNIFKDTKNLISKPWSGEPLKAHWDIRYVNRVYKYHNSEVDFSKLTGLDFKDSLLFVGTKASKSEEDASIAGVKCVNKRLAAGTTINLYDAPEQFLEYSGPQSTFAYRLANLEVTKPWKANGSGNLLLQANFVKPIYKNFEDNMGGGVYFGVMLRNVKNDKLLNFVINIYSIGKGWLYEQKDLKYDPTTKIVHIATSIDKNSIWSTMSPKSNEVVKVLSTPDKVREEKDKWSRFYRVNITYDNMISVLQELRNHPPLEIAGEDYGLNPQDWKVEMVYIQYELEEEGGGALLSGSFRGFEVYTSKLPL